MAHTPGPWTAVRGGTSVINGLSCDYPDTVRHVYRDGQGRRCTVFVASCEAATLPNSENAALIAAAPELLDFVKSLRAQHAPTGARQRCLSCGLDGDCCSTYSMADALIAKAEGK